MAFQFQCPQGHLLEVEEMDAGKTCQCPYCGLTLAIPVPAGRLPQTPPTVTISDLDDEYTLGDAMDLQATATARQAGPG